MRRARAAIVSAISSMVAMAVVAGGLQSPVRHAGFSSHVFCSACSYVDACFAGLCALDGCVLTMGGMYGWVGVGAVDDGYIGAL